MVIDQGRTLFGKFSTKLKSDGTLAATGTFLRFARLQAGELRLSANDAAVRWTDHAFGEAKADAVFWRGRSNPPWIEVRDRVITLLERDACGLDDFVRRSLDTTADPMVVTGLAQHPVTRSATRQWLIDQFGGNTELLRRRLSSNRAVGASVAGAATLLLDSALRDEIVQSIEDLYEIPDSRFFQFIDSLGFRLSSATGAPRRPERGGARRLIITDELEDASELALLLGEAERATVLVTSDTFGKSDLSKVEEWCGIDEIVVEHVRTRIPRFSSAYVELHTATAQLAREIVEQLEVTHGPADDLRSTLELGVADFLFFRALRVRAIEELLKDDLFDHVVVAVDSFNRSREFLRTIAAADGLLDDDRVEVVSVSPSPGDRQQFWTLIDEIVEPTEPPDRQFAEVPESLIFRKLAQDGRRLAGLMLPQRAGSRAPVLVATSGVAAYLDSTPGYIADLRQAFETRVIGVGGDIEALREALDEETAAVFDSVTPAPGRFVPLADLLRPRLRSVGCGAARTDAVAAGHKALRFGGDRLIREVVGPVLLFAAAIDHWLSVQAKAGVLPKVVVLTPQRSPWVSLVAPVARRFGVPTIAVEPHAQDANYCRYSKVPSDYYGVMSDYFRHRTADGFGIDLDRVFAIGSPRQVAPAGYDPERSQASARAAFQAQHGRRLDDQTALVFFCQPSAWEHVGLVWDTVLRAAEANGCVVLLKTHPEEAVSRVQQYLSTAHRMGLSEQVILLDTDPATAIELSDMVLTGYSTGAVDAAIRQKPVVCVSVGDVAYPVDLSAMLDVPMTRSADELSSVIRRFQEDPSSFAERARAFIAEENQFLEGPGQRLRELVAHAISAGESGRRGTGELPHSLFLDEPHPLFSV